ncbi:clamp-binding protein CrfC [Superficieibacter electus]|uniref:Clamp-binding protein CrfC n=1 Tax=Superficieibacter electus TaxID=2022662 RepID=A0A2P5GLZ8_9ENTR|nr:clamp-binding protein CrfC [Superficieibacter electus]POP43073.1 clamp-binding protein CrfC [Superficieibacter electus]POP46568.1 clamp-binding protein CrfC [Superficieibacter electus]
MYTQTIYELSQEAERLLQLAQHHLQAIKIPLPEVLEGEPTINGSQYQHHFSARGIEAQQATLNNELRKITRLEMVLAIVGTMKAGKSTTINAIVGTEVLPNRNRPMTALPTLIRHTSGQKEPILHFSHVAPIEKLMHVLQNSLLLVDRQTLAQHLEIDKDMALLLESIANGVAFEKHYLGAEPIFHCLKSLNDLVRLSRALDVDFPFSDYAAIEHIPVIEVEFIHLSGMDTNPGQLTLLDTPGPNEAGQPHLQKMLNEQLARASAVLAVMDYTQLKSISDHEVRQAISAVGRSVPLYALVNKFDQKDRNSDDAEQVRALISGTLMKGLIAPGQIFPVSSMWGYLANRARYELATFGKLPDPDDQRWVQDFAEAALGRRWRTADLDDIEHIRHAADLLWEDSLFERPIMSLLHAAHANASLYALRSASHKLLNYAQSAREYLEFRHQGLTITFDALQCSIGLLEEDMTQLRLKQEGVRDEIDHEVKQWLTAATEFVERQRRETQRAIEDGFRPVRLLSLMNLSHADLRQDNDTGHKQLVLSNEGQAQIILSKIRVASETTLTSAHDTAARELGIRFSQLESTLTRALNDTLRPIEQRIKQDLNQSGFGVHIGLPSFQAGSVNFNAPQLFNDVIFPEENEGDVPSRASGVREAVSRWLNNPNWGWDDYVISRTRYVIDLTALEDKLIQHINAFYTQLLADAVAQVELSVSSGMSTFFNEFSQTLSELQKSLQDSLVLRQQRESTVKTLRQQLQYSLTAVQWIQEDARLLRDDIQTLFAAENP